MPKQKNSYTEKQLKQLQREVERVFGRKILTTKDCQQLQQDINDFPMANTSLGLNTVRRFFNIIQSETSISNHTMNVFSYYCGYESFNDFISTDLFATAYHDGANTNLIKILYGENLEQKGNKLFASLHTEVLEMVLTNATVFQAIFPKMVRYPLFQEYVLSFHPMIDQLNQDWYMKGMRIFTRRSKITHLKVFGLALEFLRHFLNDELNKCESLIIGMQQLEKELFKDHQDKPYPQARLIASMFIYFTHTGNKNATDACRYNTINHLFDNLEKKSKQEQGNQFDFLMCICDYLLLFEEYDLAAELIDFYPTIFDNEHSTTARQMNAYTTIVSLIKATCYFHTRRKREAKKLLQAIKISNLTFEFKKFYTVRYLMLQMKMSNNHSTAKFQAMQQQATILIKELGFKRFQHQLTAITER